MWKFGAPYILAAGTFAAYLLWAPQKNAWPAEFVLWPWLVFAGTACVHQFYYGLQDTTRNIARIYLLLRDGLQYSRSAAQQISEILVPMSIVNMVSTSLWQILEVVSFASVLFVQGWGTAIVAQIAFLLMSSLLPVRHAGHIRRVRVHAFTLLPGEQVRLTALGAWPGVLEVIEIAFRERRNVQRWWTEIMAGLWAGDVAQEQPVVVHHTRQTGPTARSFPSRHVSQPEVGGPRPIVLTTEDALLVDEQGSSKQQGDPPRS